MLITFEGIEGSGKSTQAKNLYRWLSSKGFDCLLTKEPGATLIGKKLREVLLIPRQEKITTKCELFLYLADRSQHIELIIKPALKENKIVIVDRFFDSTIAYQGYGRGLSIEFLTRLNEFVLETLLPDLTFLLDLDPEEGLRRVKTRNKKDPDSRLEIRFELEKLSFHQRVREGYLSIQRENPERIILLDARKSEKELFQRVISVVKTKLKIP